MEAVLDYTEAIPAGDRHLLTVSESATLLRVSETWIRRHARELPLVRVGRLVRFDRTLLIRQFQGKQSVGNRLRPERSNMGLRRYQRGYVKKIGNSWYGWWREDIQQLDGGFTRRQRKKKLGTASDIPTKSAAYEVLARLMSATGKPSMEMNFADLYKRWQMAVVPTLGTSSAKLYQYNLRSYIVPVFGQILIQSIGRYDIEVFLAEKAQIYSRNTLRGMRVSIGKVLTWAVACGWLEKNPCSGVKLPNSGRRVVRTILKSDQVMAIANRLKEPYSTLVLFLAVTGLRISEAIAIKWTDFEGDVLKVCRRVYDRREGALKTEHSNRELPIPLALLVRMKALGGTEWVFRSLSSTPVNPGNALRRYLRPAVRELGIPIGGWHDFRHTLNTSLRKNGWSAKVRSEVLGHSTLDTTERVYDHADRDDFRAALGEIASELLPVVTNPISIN